jgi:hypothetical protein
MAGGVKRMRRRQLLALSGAAVLLPLHVHPANALGGTAAISTPIAGPVRLRMQATSLAKNKHWGIYVQEVVVTDGKIEPTALIACFEFGRTNDPSVYAQIESTVLPLTASPEDSYKIAIYFFENRKVELQAHSDEACLANRLQVKLDANGRTLQMRAGYWEQADLPNAAIHDITIGFEYPVEN